MAGRRDRVRFPRRGGPDAWNHQVIQWTRGALGGQIHHAAARVSFPLERAK